MDKDQQYIQYSSGFSAPSGWRNFDASPTLRFERLPVIGRLYTKNATPFPENVEYVDIVKGLPIAADSYAGVYYSHVLEHLLLNDFRIALDNTYNVLQAGGIFRLVLSDLDYLARQYLNDHTNEAAYVFMRDSYLGIENRPRHLKGLPASWLGNSQHLWMRNYKPIARKLLKAGFIEVRHAAFGDCADALFLRVEEQGRCDNCLGVEGKKPLKNAR